MKLKRISDTSLVSSDGCASLEEPINGFVWVIWFYWKLFYTYSIYV